MNLKSSSFGFLIIAICFVFSGSCNTIVAKWIDKLKGVNRDGLDVPFNHPFVQSWFMFVGEFLCLIAFNVQLCWMRYNGHEIIPGVHESLPMNRFWFAIPALCDTCGTTLLYIGMTMTHASVAQMLRGSSMIFTALISYLFLDQRLRMYHLVGIGFTLSGLCLVGISSMLLESKSLDATNPIAGNICIICAQLVVGIQMVAEEKILSKHSVPPLQTVGWEGVWGITIISSILGLFQALPYVHHEWKIPDDFIDGAIQIYNGKVLKVAVSGAILSIAFFNYFGLSITKRASATTRTVLDSIRTLFIWIFGLLVHWQNFQWLQPVGFVLMLLGTAIYRGFIRIPRLSYEEVEDLAKDSEENAVLIQSIA